MHDRSRPGRGWSRRLPAALAVAALIPAVAACGTANNPPDKVAAAAAPALQTVKIGVGPFLDNQTLDLGEQLGFAKDLGLRIKSTILPSNNAIYQAIRTGDIDVGAGTLRGLQPIVKSAPELRNFMFKDQFLGFFFVGRKGSTPVYADLVAGGASPAAAKAQVLRSFVGKSFDLIKLQNFAPLASGLKAGGIDPSKVKINDFSDDAKAALAFEGGRGDFYTGALPQQSKLLLDHPDKYVNVGGYEILGPAGLSYDTWATSDRFLTSKPAIARKLVALQLRVARYIRERLPQAAPKLAALVTKASSTELPVSTVKLLASQFTKFLTPADLTDGVFSSASPVHWENEAKLDAEQNAKDLPSGFQIGQADVEQTWFDNYKADPKLVAWVDKPLP
jgi:ABC-type nitrate/sulfonate/bicarbonate transport system substrate-binding protein